MDCELILDWKTCTNSFWAYFTRAGKNIQSKLPSFVDAVWKSFDHSVLQKNINLHHLRFELTKTFEICKYRIFKRLNRGKSPGHDEIRISFIVDGAEGIAGPYDV